MVSRALSVKYQMPDIKYQDGRVRMVQMMEVKVYFWEEI